MGCRCCRMIKSYIYDPSVAVDVRKPDSAGSSLYQPHQHPGGALSGDRHSGHSKQKHGFQNLGYSKSTDSTLRLEVDNNQVNYRLHAAPSNAKELQQQGSAPRPDGGLYIIQPEGVGPRWAPQETSPSQVPVYPNVNEYESQATTDGWDSSIGECGIRKSLSADEIDEGVGGTPDYPCDTGDEGSVLSVDIHTSTTSLSSADTRDGLTLPKATDVSTMESGISVGADKSEDEVQSVTDSMVAEALAALEAATAGEDCE